MDKYKDEIDKTIGDVFSITPSSYIMNEKAYKILYPYLKKHSQIFKINNNGTIFYVINVTDLIDCLDYDNSEIKRFPSSGRIMRVIKYVFKNEKGGKECRQGNSQKGSDSGAGREKGKI